MGGKAVKGTVAFKRILLKISGEALMGSRSFGIDLCAAGQVASEIRGGLDMGVQVAVVIGGGNICRGLSVAAEGVDRASADYMGMLATVMNALAVQSALEELGVQTRVQSAIPMTSVCETYVRRRALRHLEKGRVVIFAAGTGNPFFTTDTAAALRASEIGCDALFKGTNVDGVYSEDPRTHRNAEKYARLTYVDFLTRGLRVMDMTAVSLAREGSIPIVVFSIRKAGNFLASLRGEDCTIIAQDERAVS